MTRAGSVKNTKRPFGKVQHLPSGRWQASHMVKDRRYFAPVTYGTEKQARTWLTTQEAARISGTWRPPAEQAPTLADYSRRWLERRTDLANTTRELYQSQLRLHIAPPLGTKHLDDLTPAVIERWLGAERRAGPTVAAQSYRLLRAILNTAKADGLLTENPCRVKGGGAATVQREERIPTPYEVASIAGEVLPRWRALILTLAWGGLRIGEALALARCDVDLESGTVRVRRRVYRLPDSRELDVAAPKTKASVRVVALPSSVVGVLASHLAEHVGARPESLLWPAAGGKFTTPSTFTAVFRSGCIAAGVEPYRVHDLRAFALTQAAYTGASVRELQDRAGHATASAAMLYQRSVANRQRELADRLDVVVLDAEAVGSVAKRRALRSEASA